MFSKKIFPERNPVFSILMVIRDSRLNEKNIAKPIGANDYGYPSAIGMPPAQYLEHGTIDIDHIIATEYAPKKLNAVLVETLESSLQKHVMKNLVLPALVPSYVETASLNKVLYKKSPAQLKSLALQAVNSLISDAQKQNSILSGTARLARDFQADTIRTTYRGATEAISADELAVLKEIKSLLESRVP